MLSEGCLEGGISLSAWCPEGGLSLSDWRLGGGISLSEWRLGGGISLSLPLGVPSADDETVSAAEREECCLLARDARGRCLRRRPCESHLSTLATMLATRPEQVPQTCSEAAYCRASKIGLMGHGRLPGDCSGRLMLWHLKMAENKTVVGGPIVFQLSI